jgi:hypothetical protein
MWLDRTFKNRRLEYLSDLHFRIGVRRIEIVLARDADQREERVAAGAGQPAPIRRGAIC